MTIALNVNVNVNMSVKWLQLLDFNRGYVKKSIFSHKPPPYLLFLNSNTFCLWHQIFPHQPSLIILGFHTSLRVQYQTMVCFFQSSLILGRVSPCLTCPTGSLLISILPSWRPWLIHRSEMLLSFLFFMFWLFRFSSILVLRLCTRGGYCVWRIGFVFTLTTPKKVVGWCGWLWFIRS